MNAEVSEHDSKSATNSEADKSNSATAGTAAKQTPLFKEHQRLGARFTEFSGWTMPISYSGIVDEHKSVRSLAGLFDVSHMGEIRVTGKNALPYLQYVTTNDVSKLKIGEAQYSLLLNPKGGVVDDIIVYRMAEQDYLLCVNAGNTSKDWDWLQSQNSIGAALENQSAAFGQLALQGPHSRQILSQYLDQHPGEYSVDNFRPFTFRTVRHKVDGIGIAELIIACTGYTGEDGFEIFCPTEATAEIWRGLLDVGAPLGLKAIGLGARDTLRLEVCYPLHGHELRDDVSALSSGVGWVIKFDKGEFIGREALLNEKTSNTGSKLVGIEVIDRGIVRDGAKLFTPEKKEIGWVTSGTKTPTVDKAIGLAFVQPGQAALGTQLFADVRGKLLNVQVIRKPFYKRL